MAGAVCRLALTVRAGLSIYLNFIVVFGFRPDGVVP